MTFDGALLNSAKMDRSRARGCVGDVCRVLGLLCLVPGLTLTEVTGSLDMCQPNTEEPYLIYFVSDMQVQIKVDNTNYFIEYDNEQDAGDGQRTRVFINGTMHTVFSYNDGHGEAAYCADDPSFLPRYNDLRLFHDLHPNRFQIANTYISTYIGGNETVRGMPVNHWQHCPLGNYSMDIYTLKKSNIGVYYPASQQPIRMIEKGVSQPTRIYDIVINPAYVDPEDYLAEIADVTCVGTTGVSHRDEPRLLGSYSASVVMEFTHRKYATTRQLFYDDEMKLGSSSMLILPGHDFMTRFGHGYVTIVHDYGDDLQYVIDLDQGNCTVEPLWRERSGFPFSGPWDPAAVNTPGLFDLSAFNLTSRYVYQTSIRDIGVDGWVGARTDWPSTGVNTTVEVFYSRVSWATEGLDMADPRIQNRLIYATDVFYTANNKHLVGISYRTTDNETSYGKEIPAFTHVHEYRPGAPHLSVFDVSACYNTRQIRRLIFSVRACFRVLLRHDPGLFEAAVRKFVVDACGITPIRVNNIEVVAGMQERVDVHIQLLDVPPLKGKLELRSSVSLEDAVWRLGLAIDQHNDVGITVNYPEGLTTVAVIPGSLRSDNKLMGSFETGHSGGTLAATGVVMMCLGMVVAPAAAYVIWKKNVPFPYFNQ